MNFITREYSFNFLGFTYKPCNYTSGNWTSVLRQKLLFLCRHRQFYEPHMQSHWWFVYGWCEQLFVCMLARFHWRFLWDKLALKAYYSTNHTSNCRKVKTEVISTNYLLIFFKDIYDCANHTCANGALCVDRVNNYSCSCMAGFTGDRCETGKELSIYFIIIIIYRFI